MGIFSFFKKQIRSSTQKINDTIQAVFFTKKRIDDDTLNQIFEILIKGDIGPQISNRIIEQMKSLYFQQDIDYKSVLNCIYEMLLSVFLSCPSKNIFHSYPLVITIFGLNGSGKTTTIGKLAYKLKNDKKNGLIVCADTFRAGAVNQLEILAQKVNVETISNTNKDPSGLVFDGIKQGIYEKKDYIIIDTAGRMHTNTNLMNELTKIQNIVEKSIKKNDPNNNTQSISLMVIDGSIGQNAYNQIDSFLKYVKIDGLIITKLDTTAKGGTLVSITEEFKIPTYFIGTGESLTDLIEFNPHDFCKDILE